MKVLIAGNSQSAALKRAFDGRRARKAASGLDLHFYVVPGGSGPDFQVLDDRLVVGTSIATHPPFVDPPGTDLLSLSGFDAIVISALGYVDGGFRYTNPITNAAILGDCEPRGRAKMRAPVSDTTAAAIVSAMLERQNGIRSMRRIVGAFRGPVLVQRFPNLSEAILDHEDWRLRQWYRAPIKAHAILSQARDTALDRIAGEIGAQLLDYPVAEHPRGFTPRSMMQEDCIHPSQAYAEMILDQIAARLTAT